MHLVQILGKSGLCDLSRKRLFNTDYFQWAVMVVVKVSLSTIIFMQPKLFYFAMIMKHWSQTFHGLRCYFFTYWDMAWRSCTGCARCDCPTVVKLMWRTYTFSVGLQDKHIGAANVHKVNLVWHRRRSSRCVINHGRAYENINSNWKINLRAATNFSTEAIRAAPLCCFAHWTGWEIAILTLLIFPRKKIMASLKKYIWILPNSWHLWNKGKHKLSPRLQVWPIRPQSSWDMSTTGRRNDNCPWE